MQKGGNFQQGIFRKITVPTDLQLQNFKIIYSS